MMRPIKEYWCDNSPKYEDIINAHSVCCTIDCVIILRWFVKYNGHHKLIIKKEDNIEDLWNQVPKIYGV